MSCDDPDCSWPTPLPMPLVARVAENLVAHGWVGAGLGVITALNARVANRESALFECLFGFMLEHIVPEFERLEPGLRAQLIKDILATFGENHPDAARVARALGGHA